MSNEPKALLKAVLGSNVVRYYPSLAPVVGGATAALMLSQLLYWVYNETMSRKAQIKDGWFYINCEEMETQTGLTKNEQRTAREKLIERNIIEVSYKGHSPRTTHYRINVEVISTLLQSSEKSTIENVDDQSLEKQPTNGTESSPLVDGKPHHFNTDTTENTNTTTERQQLIGSDDLLIGIFKTKEVAGFTPDYMTQSRVVDLMRDILNNHPDFGAVGLRDHLKKYADDWRGRKSQAGRPYKITNIAWVQSAAADEPLQIAAGQTGSTTAGANGGVYV